MRTFKFHLNFYTKRFRKMNSVIINKQIKIQNTLVMIYDSVIQNLLSV